MIENQMSEDPAGRRAIAGGAPDASVANLSPRQFRDLPAICLSSNHWADLMARPQQLMLRYSRRAPVLFVEPLAGIRQAIKGKNVKPRMREVSPRLWTLSVATAVPVDRGVPERKGAAKTLRAANDSLLRLSIEHAADRLEMRSHLLWCMFYGTPTYKRLPRTSLVVYDCMDDWSAWYRSRPDVLARETELIAMSDLVFTVSQPLYESMKRRNPHTYLVRNGVDFEHFEAASKGQVAPVAMEKIPHPIIGFYGRVDTWVALDMIGAIARKRPEWSFVLIGPVDEEYRRHPQSPNMHYLGPVSYKTLPQYVAQFDVCLVPFKRTAFSEGADPIKMYEYLATGKPIVSTGFPEARKFADLIYTADDETEFERAIVKALGGESSDIVQSRRAAAKENSWDSRLEQAVGIINGRREELGV